MTTYNNALIDTDLDSDIFAIERELENAQAETDAVIADIFRSRGAA